MSYPILYHCQILHMLLLLPFRLLIMFHFIKKMPITSLYGNASRTVHIDSRLCGTYACFYNTSKLQGLEKILRNLIPQVKKLSIVYDTTTKQLSTPKAYLEMLLPIMTKSKLGVRIEALDLSNVGKDTSQSIEAIDTFKNIKRVFKTHAIITKHTTYAPLVIEKKRVYMLILHLKAPTKYVYDDVEMFTDTIILSFQESCQVELLQLVADKAFKPMLFKTYMLQIKETLNLMHTSAKNSQFHGDLKWENMVYCKENKRAKLIDFPTRLPSKRFDITGSYHFVHSWKFTPQRDSSLYSLFGWTNQQTEEGASNTINGALYDRICYNMLIAAYCVYASQPFTLYKACHFNAATKYIIKNRLTVDDNRIYAKGLKLIQTNKHLFK